MAVVITTKDKRLVGYVLPTKHAKRCVDGENKLRIIIE
tara:strand:+ start:163 stop:276 length:114 start_codon:yes stop_codon:yes gene_type:complete